MCLLTRKLILPFGFVQQYFDQVELRNNCDHGCVRNKYFLNIRARIFVQVTIYLQ